MINDRPLRLRTQIEQLWNLTSRGQLRWRWESTMWRSDPFNNAPWWAGGPSLTAEIVPARQWWDLAWVLRVLRDGHEIEECRADDWDLRGSGAAERMGRLIELLHARHPGWVGSTHRT